MNEIICTKCEAIYAVDSEVTNIECLCKNKEFKIRKTLAKTQKTIQ